MTEDLFQFITLAIFDARHSTAVFSNVIDNGPNVAVAAVAAAEDDDNDHYHHDYEEDQSSSAKEF